MKSSANKNERPEAYAKPAETDAQLKNQDVYMERQSARRNEDVPVHSGKEQHKKPKQKREERWDIL